MSGGGYGDLEIAPADKCGSIEITIRRIVNGVAQGPGALPFLINLVIHFRRISRCNHQEISLGHPCLILLWDVVNASLGCPCRNTLIELWSDHRDIFRGTKNAFKLLLCYGSTTDDQDFPLLEF